MGKLSRTEAAAHRKACDLVALGRALTWDEREFVLEHWNELSTATNTLDGVFFTPLGLARDLGLHAAGDRINDLCAGIGRLAFESRRYWDRRANNGQPRELVCVERNPTLVEVGRKVLPDAEWILGDVLNVPAMGLGRFSCAISNPPFGRIARNKDGPRYRGGQFELHVIDIAAEIADHGVFLIPQQSAPFTYSGPGTSSWTAGPHYQQFRVQTGIKLRFNIGVDTAYYDGQWRGVCPRTEIVTSPLVRRTPSPNPAPSSGRRAAQHRDTDQAEQLSLLPL